MIGTVWYLRFPHACRDAGPFRFFEPVTEREFLAAMEKHFGLEIGQDECTIGTKLWVEGQEPLRIGQRRKRCPLGGKLDGYREEIIRRREAGEKVARLAKSYGVSRQAIYDCLR